MVLPGMSDGRAFTSYVSNCQYNNELIRQQNIQDSNAYRKYLQDNADVILNSLKQKNTK